MWIDWCSWPSSVSFCWCDNKSVHSAWLKTAHRYHLLVLEVRKHRLAGLHSFWKLGEEPVASFCNPPAFLGSRSLPPSFKVHHPVQSSDLLLFLCLSLSHIRTLVIFLDPLGSTRIIFPSQDPKLIDFGKVLLPCKANTFIGSGDQDMDIFADYFSVYHPLPGDMWLFFIFPLGKFLF